MVAHGGDDMCGVCMDVSYVSDNIKEVTTILNKMLTCNIVKGASPWRADGGNDAAVRSAPRDCSFWTAAVSDC